MTKCGCRFIESNAQGGQVRGLPSVMTMLAWIVIVTFFTLTAFPPNVQAMLVPMETEGTGSALHRVDDTQKIQRFLEAKIVQQRLMDFGLTSEEISSRLSELSDDEIHRVAAQIDSLIPGGDALGIVIALLVVAILVVILIYLLNHKIVIQKQ